MRARLPTITRCLLDPGSVSIPSRLFTAVQKPAYLGRIFESAVSLCSLSFTHVTFNVTVSTDLNRPKLTPLLANH
jgi:hypothetical protein